MIQTSPEFQLALAFSSGLFFGAYSMGLLFTFIYIVIFEFIVFCTTIMDPPPKKIELWMDRLFINLVFFCSWSISRFLYLRETGFEPVCDYVDLYFNH